MTYTEKDLKRFTSEDIDALDLEMDDDEWWQPIFKLLKIKILEYEPANHPVDDTNAFLSGNGFRFTFTEEGKNQYRFGYIYNKVIRFNKPKQVRVIEVLEEKKT